MLGLKRTLLIVEDEQTLLHALHQKFVGVGYEVYDALDGESAIVLARKLVPTVIILDLILPKMDGIEVLRQLKKEESTSLIPVLVLTNLSDEKTIAEVIAAGGNDYFVKADYTLDDIVNKVEEVLSRKKKIRS